MSSGGESRKILLMTLRPVISDIQRVCPGDSTEFNFQPWEASLWSTEFMCQCTDDAG